MVYDFKELNSKCLVYTKELKIKMIGIHNNLNIQSLIMLRAPWFCDSTFYYVLHHRSFRRNVENRKHHNLLRLLFEHIRLVERTDLLNDGSEF